MRQYLIERRVRYGKIIGKSIKISDAAPKNLGTGTPPDVTFPTESRKQEATMSVEDIKKRFINEIKLRAYDDKYLDKNEEREILQIAIQLGVNIDSARGALVQVCDDQGYVLESQLAKQIKDQVEAAAGNDGKVDQKEFDMIFHTVKKTAQGKKNDRDLKKMIVQVMEDSGNNKVKTGWFSDWYTTLKKDLGMA